MFEDVKQYLLGEKLEPGNLSSKPDTFDLRTATMTVLVHVAGIDGNFAKDEMHHLFGSMCRNWEIFNEEAGDLLSVAEILVKMPGKVDEILGLIKDNFDDEHKTAILTDVWRVILADNVGEAEELIEAREIRKKLGLTLEQAVLAQKLASRG